MSNTPSMGATKVRVLGRTPGDHGKAPMVAEVGNSRYYLAYGSHHEAAYRACIIAMIQESQTGNGELVIGTTSEHLRSRHSAYTPPPCHRDGNWAGSWLSAFSAAIHKLKHCSTV